MTTKRLTFKPGVDVEKSPSLNNGGWSTSNCVRWREGLPESLLGFAQTFHGTATGVCRALHFWVDLTSVPRFSLGTNTHLYIFNTATSNQTEITPAIFTPGNASSGSTPFSLLVWSLDNFGQNLIAIPSGQTVFQWVPPTLTQATAVTNAPSFNNGGLVLDQLQICLVWGSSVGSVQDKMLLRWCDQSDLTAWTALTTNLAGSYRIPHGSRIVAGLSVPGETMIWTDIGLWGLQYIGFPLVFSVQPIGQNCGLIAQKAVCVLGQVVYWMSDHGFFRATGGSFEQMPCPIWDIVYKDLDTANQDKCLAGTNYHYSEVYFFYPSLSGGSGEIDSYVKVNVQEGGWDYGKGTPNAMARTAWTDVNQPGPPVSVDLAGLMQQADQGFTQNGGAAMPSSIRSGYTDIMDGGEIAVVDRFLPDFLWDGTNPNLNITFYFRSYPGDTPTSLGPFNITPTTEYVSLQLPKNITIGTTTVQVYVPPRGREIAIQIDGVAGWWRLGNCRLRIQSAGSRP